MKKEKYQTAIEYNKKLYSMTKKELRDEFIKRHGYLYDYMDNYKKEDFIVRLER